MGAAPSTEAVERFAIVEKKVRQSSQGCKQYHHVCGLRPMDSRLPYIWLFGEDHGAEKRRDCQSFKQIMSTALTCAHEASSGAEPATRLFVELSEADISYTDDTEKIDHAHAREMTAMNALAKSLHRRCTGIAVVPADPFSAARSYMKIDAIEDGASPFKTCVNGLYHMYKTLMSVEMAHQTMTRSMRYAEKYGDDYDFSHALNVAYRVVSKAADPLMQPGLDISTDIFNDICEAFAHDTVEKVFFCISLFGDIITAGNLLRASDPDNAAGSGNRDMSVVYMGMQHTLNLEFLLIASGNFEVMCELSEPI
jgi:hypothetical protein